MQRQPGPRLLHAAELLTHAAAERNEAEFTACVAAAVQVLPLSSLVRGGDDEAGMTHNLAVAEAGSACLCHQQQHSVRVGVQISHICIHIRNGNLCIHDRDGNDPCPPPLLCVVLTTSQV